MIFVSHCLLNENVRYLGGAGRSAGVEELVYRYMHAGVGVYQMPCPEQRVWGGVLKRHLLSMYGIRLSWVRRLRRPLSAVAIRYSKFAYARVAHGVVQDIADYVQSGFEVVGIVGISASPSCGVLKTLDMARSWEVIARCNRDHSNAIAFNEALFASALVEGPGYFITALRTRLARRHLDIPFLEHDLVGELYESGLLHSRH